MKTFSSLTRKPTRLKITVETEKIWNGVSKHCAASFRAIRLIAYFFCVCLLLRISSLLPPNEHMRKSYCFKKKLYRMGVIGCRWAEEKQKQHNGDDLNIMIADQFSSASLYVLLFCELCENALPSWINHSLLLYYTLETYLRSQSKIHQLWLRRGRQRESSKVIRKGIRLIVSHTALFFFGWNIRDMENNCADSSAKSSANWTSQRNKRSLSVYFSIRLF